MEYPKQGAANAAPCGYCVLQVSDNPLLYHWFNRYFAAHLLRCLPVRLLK